MHSLPMPLLIMPSLPEGEVHSLRMGVPVLCSDIPMMQEHIIELGE